MGLDHSKPEYTLQILKTPGGREYVQKYEASVFIVKTALAGHSFLNDPTCKAVFNHVVNRFCYGMRQCCEFIPKKQLDDALTLLKRRTEKNQMTKLQDINISYQQFFHNVLAKFREANRSDDSIQAFLSELCSPKQLFYTPHTIDDPKHQCQRVMQVLIEVFKLKSYYLFPKHWAPMETYDKKIVRVFKDGDNIFAFQKEFDVAVYGDEKKMKYPKGNVTHWETYNQEEMCKMLTERNRPKIKYLIQQIDRSTTQTFYTPSLQQSKLAIDVMTDLMLDFDYESFCTVTAMIRRDQSKRLTLMIRDLFLSKRHGQNRNSFFITKDTIERVKKLHPEKQPSPIEIPERYRKAEEKARTKLLEFVLRDRRHKEICFLKAAFTATSIIHEQKGYSRFSVLCCDYENTRLKDEFATLYKNLLDIADDLYPMYQNESDNDEDLELTKKVRLFTDGRKRFVMRDELNFALYGIEVKSFQHQDDARNWYTYTEHQAVVMKEKSGIQVEFLITPITRFKRFQTPIGTNCQLALEVMLDVSKDTLKRHGFFNIYRFCHPESFAPLYKKLLNCFICHPETPVFFIGDEAHNQMKQSLTAQLPEIDSNYVPDFLKSSVAKAVATLVNWVNRDSRNTNICLLKTIPGLETFIHSQKGCKMFPTMTCCNMKDWKVKELEEEYDKINEYLEKIALKIKEYKRTNQLNEKLVERSVEKKEGAKDAVKTVGQKANQDCSKLATKEAGQQTTEPEATECAKCVRLKEVCETNVRRQRNQNEIPIDRRSSKPVTKEVGQQTSTPECNACVKMEEVLKTVRSQRNSAQNSVNKLEKKLAKQEKELEKFEQCKRHVAVLEEEKRQLKREGRKQLEDLQRSVKVENALRSDMTKLKKENSDLKGTITSLEKRLKKFEKELSSYKPMSPEERKDVMRTLEDRLETLYREDPIEKAEKKYRNLNCWLECPVLLSEVQEDVAIFHEQITDFQQSLLRMMDTVNDNPNLTRRELPAFPTCPEQPERFRKLFEEENEKNNRQVEGECPICFGLKEGKELFTCKACRFEIHLECLKNQVNCPACREAVKKQKRK